MKRERTEAQREASRRNGAKSRGPKSADGIARCRRAATIHGMYSPQIIAENEDPKKYESYLASYVDEWEPVGQDERDTLAELVNARWRIRRGWGQTTGMLSTEMLTTRYKVDHCLEPVTALARTANAVHSLEESNPGMMHRLQVAEESLKRIVRSSRKELIDLQKMRLGEMPTRNACHIGEEPLVILPDVSPDEYPDPSQHYQTPDDTPRLELVPAPTETPAEPTTLETTTDPATETEPASEPQTSGPTPETESAKGPETYPNYIWLPANQYQPSATYFLTNSDLESFKEDCPPRPTNLAA